MDLRCRETQEALTDGGGRLETLAASLVVHVAECPRCAAVAAAERQLGELLAEAVPPADLALDTRLLASLPSRSLGWRMMALAPVAFSLLVAAFGAALVGGVPGPGAIVSLLPRFSAQGWLALARAASDLGVATTAAMHAAASMAPPGLHVAAALVAVAGLAACGWLVNGGRAKVVAWRAGR